MDDQKLEKLNSELQESFGKQKKLKRLRNIEKEKARRLQASINEEKGKRSFKLTKIQTVIAAEIALKKTATSPLLSESKKKKSITGIDVFRACAKRFNETEEWAKQVASFPSSALRLSSILESLEERNNPCIEQLRKLNLYDVSELKSAKNYRNFVLKLISKMELAKELISLQQHVKDLESLLANQKAENIGLKEKLRVSLSLSTKERVIELKRRLPSMTNVDLAQAVGVSRQTVGKILTTSLNK